MSTNSNEALQAARILLEIYERLKGVPSIEQHEPVAAGQGVGKHEPFV